MDLAIASTLFDGNANDRIRASGDGNDELSSGSGTDILYGRAGDDRLDVRFSTSQAFGGGGRDSVRYADEDDVLTSIEVLLARASGFV